MKAAQTKSSGNSKFRNEALKSLCKERGYGPKRSIDRSIDRSSSRLSNVLPQLSMSGLDQSSVFELQGKNISGNHLTSKSRIKQK